jgi:hypothetical protein
MSSLAYYSDASENMSVETPTKDHAMYSLAYCSYAPEKMSVESLAMLQKKAALNNLQNDVTGMLLYKRGIFLQVLEGEITAVLTTYDKIRKDPRHIDVTPIYSDFIAARKFKGWAMGFRNLEELAATASTDYPDYMNPFSAAEFSDPTAVHRLMLFFSKYV